MEKTEEKTIYVVCCNDFPERAFIGLGRAEEYAEGKAREHSAGRLAGNPLCYYHVREVPLDLEVTP